MIPFAHFDGFRPLTRGNLQRAFQSVSMGADVAYSYEPLLEGQIRLLHTSVADGKLTTELHPCSIPRS
jgi:hypothetical protein